MKRIVVTEFITLDGVIEDPGQATTHEHGGWTVPYWHDEMGKFLLDELFKTDTLLYGRVTYDIHAAAWPNMTDEEGFADRMNSLPKYVVSTTISDLPWKNSHVIGGNVVEAVTQLKQGSGQHIAIDGSSQLVQALMQHNLVDEFRLLVYPVVLGSGKRLFEDVHKADLELVETRTFPSGVVLLRYELKQ